MKITTQEDYDQIADESHSTTVVLDFYADWCGPCRRYSPIFEKVAESTTGVIFASVDCDALPEVTSALGIQGIPCTVVMRDGKVQSRKAGLIAENDLRKFVADGLAEGIVK